MELLGAELVGITDRGTMHLDDGSTITVSTGDPVLLGFKLGDVVQLTDPRPWWRKVWDVLLAVLRIRPLPRYSFVVTELGPATARTENGEAIADIQITVEASPIDYIETAIRWDPLDEGD